MERSELAGKALTVLGPIDPEELGITLMHDHVFMDLTVWFEESEKSTEKLLARQPVSLENLSWVLANEYKNWDNMLLLDEQMAIKELITPTVGS